MVRPKVRFCPAGHDTFVVGRRSRLSGGSCSACHVLANRSYRAAGIPAASRERKQAADRARWAMTDSARHNSLKERRRRRARIARMEGEIEQLESLLASSLLNPATEVAA